MANTDLLDEIRDMNLAYLMLAQRLLKEDRATAQFRLKLDDDMADAIGLLSARQLGQLARTNQFLFQFKLASAGQLGQVFGKKLDPAMVQTHASLLMAGRPA